MRAGGFCACLSGEELPGRVREVRRIEEEREGEQSAERVVGPVEGALNSTRSQQTQIRALQFALHPGRCISRSPIH